jgi:hypothetical protein
MSEGSNFDFNNNKLRRLKDAGNLVRMSDDRVVKTVFLGQPDGRRKAGIPYLTFAGPCLIIRFK